MVFDKLQLSDTNIFFNLFIKIGQKGKIAGLLVVEASLGRTGAGVRCGVDPPFLGLCVTEMWWQCLFR